MEKLKLEVIKKILMLDTIKELQIVRDNVSDSLGREYDKEEREEEEFKKWKENQVNV